VLETRKRALLSRQSMATSSDGTVAAWLQSLLHGPESLGPAEGAPSTLAHIAPGAPGHGTTLRRFLPASGFGGGKQRNAATQGARWYI
jgi:hypothetical protein